MKDQIFVDGDYVASASGAMFDVVDPSMRRMESG